MAEIAKTLQLLGFLLVVGGPAFWALMWRPVAGQTGDAAAATGAVLRRRLGGVAVAGAGLVLLGAGLDVWRAVGPLVAGLPAAERIEVLTAFVSDTRLGRTRMAMAVAALVAAPAAAWLLLGRQRRGAAVGGGLAWLALSSAAVLFAVAAVMLSHAGASPMRGLAAVADAAHLAAFVTWGAVLVGLATLDWPGLERSGRSAARWLPDLLERASAAALASLVVLVAAGLWLAFVHALGMSLTFSAVREALASDYGRLIMAKLALLGLALALAAVNRFVVLPQMAGMATAGPDAWAGRIVRRFGRLARVETAVVLVIVAMAAVLSHTAPP
jgi:putative copper export protein